MRNNRAANEQLLKSKHIRDVYASGCATQLFTVLLLQTVFVILKVSGAEDWNWWVTFSPFLVSFFVYLVNAFLAGIIAGVRAAAE